MPGPTAFPETARSLRVQLREAVVDHGAFESPLRPCELSSCRATCCHDGAVLSPEEASTIRALLKTHLPSFPPAAIETPFEAGKDSLRTAVHSCDRGELAHDFPPHFPRTRCVFLDDEHKCSLQTLSASLGHHPWHFKPISCWMHPVRLRPRTQSESRPVLTLLRPANDEARFASCTPCGRPDPDPAGRPARDVLQAELRALSQIADRDFVAELNAPTAPPSSQRL